MQGEDFTGVWVETEQYPLLLLFGHLNCHDGVCGANLELLSKLGTIVKAAKAPFCLFCDWTNMPEDVS